MIRLTKSKHVRHDYIPEAYIFCCQHPPSKLCIWSWKTLESPHKRIIYPDRRKYKPSLKLQQMEIIHSKLHDQQTDNNHKQWYVTRVHHDVACEYDFCPFMHILWWKKEHIVVFLKYMLLMYIGFHVGAVVIMNDAASEFFISKITAR